VILFGNKKRFPNFQQANGFRSTSGMTKAATHAFLRIYTHAWTILFHFHLFHGAKMASFKARATGNAKLGIDLSAISARITEV
jgi:hypothetical protein